MTWGNAQFLSATAATPVDNRKCSTIGVAITGTLVESLL
jgi:hypothetical protein